MVDRFLVVGGDAAGMSAAGKVKRDAPATDVVVFERGDWVSYGACGLPYYVEGRIDHLDDLVVVDPERIVEQRDIDLRRGAEVVSVDPDAETVTVSYDGRMDEEPYDELLLATGGRGVRPSVPGASLDGVFTVRSLEAGRALRNYVVSAESRPDASIPAPGATYGADLRSYVSGTDVETVAVIGAGKIGLELAEAFVARGLSVHVFEDGPHVLPTFGPDAAAVAEDRLRERGVTLHLETSVERIRAADDGSRPDRGDESAPRGTGSNREGRVGAIETGGDVFPAEAVLADLGVEPNTELATAVGVDLGPSGAIAGDEYGRTNVANVRAAGDCAEKRHLLTGDPVSWPYALAANRAGRAIGRSVAGTPTPVGEIVGTNVMGLFGLEFARTGLLDAEARAAGYDPISTTITTISRAGYYPGWSRILVGLTADRETDRLLGASLAGEEGVVHRVNSVATALHAGMTVAELGALDFGYAPPFGPVWDPVLTAAKVLGEKLRAESSRAEGD